MPHRPLGTAFALKAALAAGLLLAATAEARIRPAWSISQGYVLHVPVGQASLAADFAFPVGQGSASLRLSYDGEGGIEGGGTVGGIDIYGVVGTSTLDVGTGEQRVHLEENSDPSRFVFDGVVASDGGDINGTGTLRAGFGGLAADQTGPLTLTRLGAKGKKEFVLTFGTRMDGRGRIRGALLTDGKHENTATLTVFGRHVFNGFELEGMTLTDGKIRGKVKTDATGATTGLVTITGLDWTANLEGPIDDQGFHALLDLQGAGFTLTDVPMTLAVQPGPTGPPKPPPRPPKNLLSNAAATIVNGQVTITHTAVPKKFFRARAGLTITFPLSDGISIVHADPSAASTQPPRRCIVTIGSTTFGTATAPADVTLDVKAIGTLPGQVIRVLATGAVVEPGGRQKKVDALIEAIVQ